MSETGLIHTSLQRGEHGEEGLAEPFQRFFDKPLKRLDSGLSDPHTSLKRGVNEKRWETGNPSL